MLDADAWIYHNCAATLISTESEKCIFSEEYIHHNSERNEASRNQTTESLCCSWNKPVHDRVQIRGLTNQPQRTKHIVAERRSKSPSMQLICVFCNVPALTLHSCSDSRQRQPVSDGVWAVGSLWEKNAMGERARMICWLMHVDERITLYHNTCLICYQ